MRDNERVTRLLCILTFDIGTSSLGFDIHCCFRVVTNACGLVADWCKCHCLLVSEGLCDQPQLAGLKQKIKNKKGIILELHSFHLEVETDERDHPRSHAALL